MDRESDPICHELPGDLRVLLHGVPCRSSRGWLGYCSIVLFQIQRNWALYDTGHFSDRALLLEALRKISLSPLQISTIIVSHLHFDHILNIPLFKNASLIVARAEIDYALGVSAGEIDDPSVPESWQSILDAHEVRIIDGPTRLDGLTEVEPLPGHTPGGLVVYRRCPEMVAICGDVIKNAWDAVSGEPAAAGVDLAAGRQSIHRVLDRSAVIVPGHDRPFSFRNGTIEFLSAFTLQLRGHLLPGPRDELMLDINLPAAVIHGTQRRSSDH